MDSGMPFRDDPTKWQPCMRAGALKSSGSSKTKIEKIRENEHRLSPCKRWRPHTRRHKDSCWPGILPFHAFSTTLWAGPTKSTSRVLNGLVSLVENWHVINIAADSFNLSAVSATCPRLHQELSFRSPIFYLCLQTGFSSPGKKLWSQAEINLSPPKIKTRVTKPVYLLTDYKTNISIKMYMNNNQQRRQPESMYIWHSFQMLKFCCHRC